jgi:toxin HigB-1
MRRVLRSFKDEDAEAIWHRQRSCRLGESTQLIAFRKLAMLDAADVVGDLRIPPSNKLQKLAGGRAGQYSIQINRQWRICFSWSAIGPKDIEIVEDR